MTSPYRLNAYTSPEQPRRTLLQRLVTFVGRLQCALNDHDPLAHTNVLGWCSRCRVPMLRLVAQQRFGGSPCWAVIPQAQWDRMHQLAVETGFDRHCSPRRHGPN